MKKLLITLAAVAAFSLPALAGVDENGVITLDGEPVEEAEPAPDPVLQNRDKTFYCVELQKLAAKVAELRDQGAPIIYPVQILVKAKRTDLVWVVRQVYWTSNIGRSPDDIGFDVWIRCNKAEREAIDVEKN